MLAMVTSTPQSHMSHCSHHRVSRSMRVNMLHIVYLLKRHRCDLVCVHLSQSRPHSHMSVPPKLEHSLCAQLLPTREVQVPPLREPTILLVQTLVRKQVLFPKPRVLVLPMDKFGKSKPDGLGYIDTVDRDLMHHQYRLSVLQWNPGPAAGTPPILSRLPVESSMRYSSRSQRPCPAHL